MLSKENVLEILYLLNILIVGLSAPTLAKSGRDLPLSRTVSLLLFPDVPIQDPKFTLAAMQYGQIITHDMSMIAGSTQSSKFINFLIR